MLVSFSLYIWKDPGQGRKKTFCEWPHLSSVHRKVSFEVWLQNQCSMSISFHFIFKLLQKVLSSFILSKVKLLTQHLKISHYFLSGGQFFRHTLLFLGFKCIFLIRKNCNFFHNFMEAFLFYQKITLKSSACIHSKTHFNPLFSFYSTKFMICWSYFNSIRPKIQERM